MTVIAKFLTIIIIILAILSYWLKPLIFVVAIIVGAFVIMIRKKKFKLMTAIILTTVVVIAILYFMTFSLMMSPPERSHVSYIAKGKYDDEAKGIVLFETIGFKNKLNQIYSPEQISLSQFIAVHILNDSSLLNYDLKSIAFSSGFEQWLEKTSWKLENFSDGNEPNDLTLWLSRTNKLILPEKLWKKASIEDSSVHACAGQGSFLKCRFMILAMNSCNYLQKFNSIIE